MYTTKTMNFPPRPKRRRWIVVPVVFLFVLSIWFWNFVLSPYLRESKAVKHIQIVSMSSPKKTIDSLLGDGDLILRNGETVQLSEKITIVYYGEAHSHWFRSLDGFIYLRINDRFFYREFGPCTNEFRLSKNDINDILENDGNFLDEKSDGSFIERIDLHAK